MNLQIQTFVSDHCGLTVKFHILDQIRNEFPNDTPLALVSDACRQAYKI